ncbi:MAG TPA: hypothetical protein VFQ23_18305, partial [Anaerolineales bacterium]|nr:hypothetical protein [Anaerolineales bacterium]
FIYLRLPALLLVLYVLLIPSPSISKIRVQGNVGYIAEGYDFTILNLTSTGQITPISSYTLPYWIRDFTIENGIAYVLTIDNSIHIVDTHQPIDNSKLAHWNSPGLLHSVEVEGNFAFLANHSEGVRVFNIQDPINPYQILHKSDIGTVLDVAATQNLIYVARGPDGLDIYDISTITKPELKGHYDAGSSINKVVLLPDGRALLQVDKQGLQIINLANPQNIILTNTFTTDKDIVRTIVNNNRIFVAQKRAGILIVRIKEDNTLESLTTIPAPRNALDAALIENTIFVAAGWRGLQALDISKIEDNHQINEYSDRFWKYKAFIGFLVVASLLFWLAFFAQFVLPVRTFVQRQMIFNRLILFLIGRHGPAIFIENGRAREQIGERQRKGPGVLWLDTASATVIRTATRFKEAIGPGVHFTKKNEFITGTVDLHTQVDVFGPQDDENPFMAKPGTAAEQADLAKYSEIQKRRMEVSALTRDGIEVVPKISITFRVDTLPSEDGQPGSRFGYRTGTSKEDKANEASDKEAIYKAIAGEGINKYRSKHRVAWNQLPLLLAVDVWREYVAKFTLEELYDSQDVAFLQPALPASVDVKIDQSEVVDQNGVDPGHFQQKNTSFLHDLNKQIESWLDRVENKNVKKDAEQKAESSASKSNETMNKTALQIINEMVKARLTFEYVQKINSIGKREPGLVESNEYKILKARGLRVLSVSISNPRVNEIVEKQRIDQWKASWLSNANAERDRIDRQRGFLEVQGKENAANEYAHDLARHIMKQKPQSFKEIVKALLMRTRLITIQKDRLQRRMGTEREDLEDILKWLEESP